MKTSLIVVPALLALAQSPALAAIGDWSSGQRSQARLVAAGVDASGHLSAGIQIVLPAGSETYWRSPGDAGVAPEFDFSGAGNLENPQIAFPAPLRENDGYAVTNIYRDGVTLILDGVVPDPKKPVDIRLELHLGVCDQICVPDDVTVNLTVPPGEDDDAAGRIVAMAQATLPGAPEPGVFALDDVVRDGGTDGRPVFRVSGAVPEPATADVFVEGPTDWAPYLPEYAGQKDGKAVYTVKFTRLGSPVAIAGAALRFTVRSAGRVIEQTLNVE